MSVVRPFRARVVRPEWARRLVSGLAELPEDTGTLPPVAPPDPEAYDEAGPALYVYRQAKIDATGIETLRMTVDVHDRVIHHRIMGRRPHQGQRQINERVVPHHASHSRLIRLDDAEAALLGPFAYRVDIERL